MKTILAFGDSLTWGADPATRQRHSFEDRWPSTLAAGLEGEARIMVDGLGGRTTVFDDPTGPTLRSGARDLPTALGTHQPLDLVIVMLGTNDLKPFLCGTAHGAVQGMRRLVQIVRTYPFKSAPVPQILIVAPPPCVGTDAGGRPVAESHRFAPLYQALAAELECAFFDAGSVIAASEIDGVHLTAEETARLGHALVPEVRKLLSVPV